MLRIKKIILLTGLVLLGSICISAQTDTFSDPNVDYSFALPDAAWKMISKPSATSPNVEYVYNDRHDAYMTIRKLSVAKDSFMTDVIRDEEQKLQFLPGYVAGKEEIFSGIFKGNAFNYEFVTAGRPMAGRFYFLRTNDTTVYVLRFTGERDKMKSIRNQTDSIARTFAVKR
jgi:hypothetical protein